jgi:hypothetical protein
MFYLSQVQMSKIETISRRESDEGYYRVVARLNPRWRVIECPDGVQWILQYRSSASAAETYARARWENRGYFRTREALTRRSTLRNVGAADLAALRILADLPDWLEGDLGPIPRLRYGRHTRLCAAGASLIFGAGDIDNLQGLLLNARARLGTQL